MALVNDRRQMAEYLTRHGPTHGITLRDALGWTAERFWDAVYGPGNRWFMLTIKGWELTEAGKIIAPLGAFA